MARATVGLDIGTSAVRAAELRGGDPNTLVRFAQMGLPPGAMAGGEIVDPDAVAQVLKELWKRGGFKTKRVYVAVANQAVIVRQVELPRMEEAELRGALAYQVQDYIPISTEDALLDYLPLDEYLADDGVEMMRVLAVAAQKDMIARVISVLERAGLQALGVDIAPLAAVRALSDQAQGLLDEPGVEGIVDVGAGITNVVVHDHGTPRFVRIILAGGNDITAGLVADLGVSVEEAETQKLAVGLREESSAHEPGAAGIIEQRAHAFLDDVVRSVEYYASQPDSAPLTRVVLCGGGSVLPGLRERLEAMLRVPVVAGDALGRIKVEDLGLAPDQLAQVSTVAAVAVGLGLEA